MLRASGQIHLKRLALLAGLLLLAAQTHALQHLHADTDDAPCNVCAASLQDDAEAVTSASTATWPATTSASPGLAVTVIHSHTSNPARARAPPPLSP